MLIILTSAEMPPTNILFGMRVPNFGMCPDKTGVRDWANDTELSLEDICWQTQHSKYNQFYLLYVQEKFAFEKTTT
jgi:hypothetical protein